MCDIDRHNKIVSQTSQYTVPCDYWVWSTMNSCQSVIWLLTTAREFLPTCTYLDLLWLLLEAWFPFMMC